MSDKGTRVGGPLYEARKRAEMDNPGSQPPVRQQVSERTGSAFVRLNSWAGITRHRIEVTGWRKDGRAVATWRDVPALRHGPGSKLYPPADAIEWPALTPAPRKDGTA